MSKKPIRKIIKKVDPVEERFSNLEDDLIRLQDKFREAEKYVVGKIERIEKVLDSKKDKSFEGLPVLEGAIDSSGARINKEKFLKSDVDIKEQPKKVFCRDCKHRIRKFDNADECRVSISSENYNEISGKKDTEYNRCTYVNDKLDCKDYEQREEKFSEKVKDKFYRFGVDGIFATILIVIVLIAVVAGISGAFEKEENKNKSSIEAPESRP